MTNGWKKLHAGCCSIPTTLRKGRIRSEDSPGPVNNVEAILGAAGNCSRHVQVFGAQRWRCGGRHRSCSGRPDQETLSSRCGDDGPDPAEVSNRTLAQEVRCLASGHVPTQVLRERAYRSGRKVQIDSLEKVLRGSGEFGVFSRPFFIKGELRVFKDVPLPDDFDFQASLREAKSVGPSIHGVVLRGKGFGLRKDECDFESVVGQVYTEEDAKRFTGKRWEVINLPLSWSNAVVQAFLAGWSCTVETSFRARKTRSAIVRSAEPLRHHRLQHDFGCALIQPTEPRKRPRAQDLVWSKLGKTTDKSQKAARSWASVVRGDSRKATAIPLPVTRPVAAKRPLAGGESMDTTDVGAISPALVQDYSQAPTQLLLLQRMQRLDTLQLPPSPVLADIAAQLQVLMASTQSIATTVGQLGGQMQSFQAEVTEMKNAENEDDELQEHDGFSSKLEEGGVAIAEARGKPKFQFTRNAPY